MSHTLLPYGFVKRCVLCGGVLCQVSPSQGYFPPRDAVWGCGCGSVLVSHSVSVPPCVASF